MKPLMKFLLILTSTLITILGAGLIFLGVVIKFYTEMIDGYLTPIVKLLSAGGGTGADVWTLYNMTTIALMAFGIVVTISGFLGCYIGVSLKKQTLITLMIITTVMIVLQMTAASLILTMKVENEIKDTLMSNLVNKYFGDEANDEYSEAWNYAMVEFSCCGAESYGDFKLAVHWDRKKMGDNGTYTVTVPVTCCKLPGEYPDFGIPYDVNCTVNPTTENSYFKQNCHEKIDDYLQYYGILMSCSFIGVVVIEGLCLAILVSVSTEMKRKTNKIKQATMDENQE